MTQMILASLPISTVKQQTARYGADSGGRGRTQLRSKSAGQELGQPARPVVEKCPRGDLNPHAR